MRSETSFLLCFIISPPPTTLWRILFFIWTFCLPYRLEISCLNFILFHFSQESCPGLIGKLLFIFQTSRHRNSDSDWTIQERSIKGNQCCLITWLHKLSMYKFNRENNDIIIICRLNAILMNIHLSTVFWINLKTRYKCFNQNNIFAL